MSSPRLVFDEVCFRTELGYVRLTNQNFWLNGSRASCRTPHVLDLAVQLANFFGWMSQGGHSEPLLLLELFYQSTPSWLKFIGGDGSCDFGFWTRA